MANTLGIPDAAVDAAAVELARALEHPVTPLDYSGVVVDVLAAAWPHLSETPTAGDREEASDDHA